MDGNFYDRCTTASRTFSARRTARNKLTLYSRKSTDGRAKAIFTGARVQKRVVCAHRLYMTSTSDIELRLRAARSQFARRGSARSRAPERRWPRAALRQTWERQQPPAERRERGGATTEDNDAAYWGVFRMEADFYCNGAQSPTKASARNERAGGE